MWLLSVDCAELRFFHSPEAVEEDGGFAALSHVWDKEEQSFQDVQRIQKRCKRKGLNPRDFVSRKIRRCCELAERHGFKWVWMDMCCIDKTSSAELSEAINSMFRYYALAGICYGYLRDVTLTRPQGRNWTGKEQWQLQGSIWFKRGWTLQELIAPHFFLFVNESWEVVGSKADFAELLEVNTRIPAAVLRLEVSYTAFSIAQRMSWYGFRETTRLEDEAYCLLGLFDMQMPPLYGEGRKAFRRLQEEIMKQSPDTTLFAWHLEYSRPWLFAEQPRNLHSCTDVRYTPPGRQHAERTCGGTCSLTGGQAVDEISFSLTPHGVLAHVPVVECRGATYADLHWADHGDRMLLQLTLDDDNGAYNVEGSARCKLVAGEYEIEQDTARASWHDVLVRDSPPLPRLPGQLLQDTRTTFVPAIPIQLALDAPFRFHEQRIRKLARTINSCDLPMPAVSIHHAEYWLPGQSHSALSTLYVFQGLPFFQVVIELGQCPTVPSPTQLPPPAQAPPQPAPSVWARVCYFDSWRSYLNEKALDRLPAHHCQDNHVSRWPDSKRVFAMSFGLMVTLSFSPCPINERTLVLDASCHTEEKEDSSIPSNSHPAVDISSIVCGRRHRA